MSVGKFLAGFAIGGAVGAIAGLLLAPKSGEETRAEISETSKELYEKAESTVRDIHAKADGVINDLTEKGEKIINNVQEFINKQKDGAEA